jgi:hypothetical protein
MTKKYSSFKEHQLITESWRKFLTEEQDEGLPSDVLQALDILSEGSLEESQPPELMDLPITRKSLAAKLSQGSGGEAAAKGFTELTPAAQLGFVALGNALTATAKGAQLVKKGGDAAAAEVKKYLEQNPEKVEALETIKKAIRRGGETAGRILKKVGMLVAAGALTAFVAYSVYDSVTSDMGWEDYSEYDDGFLDPSPGGAR